MPALNHTNSRMCPNFFFFASRRALRLLRAHVAVHERGDDAFKKEILPGLSLSQRDEPGNNPDVNGGTARRTWMTVQVQGSEPPVTLEGGQTRTISHRGASYRLHVVRSLRRDPGTNPRLPFEGERYPRTATLTPVPVLQ